jgi:alkanesulfonate monooxygenase SsuD/methylene tetrahydromethanopterin reductase-like flavin-dependent oxidoreductase (luciferase family)
MPFGVLILPDDPWSVTRERWQSAERLGFDHAWTYDHLTWRSLRDGPWLATVPTLVAAALATSRIRLGTLVASPMFRHAVPFAKELMTLDDSFCHIGCSFTCGLLASGAACALPAASAIRTA